VRAARARPQALRPRSSAIGATFDERTETPFAAWKPRETYQPIPVRMPRTWLLSTGWRRYGLVGLREVPGPKAGARATAWSACVKCPARPTRGGTSRSSSLEHAVAAARRHSFVTPRESASPRA
jgi:hypothetical protein